jgi:hypothetical protein
VASIDEGVAQAVAIARGLDGAQGAEGAEGAEGDDVAEGSSWSSRALAFAATHRGAAQRMAKQVLTGLR